ncbi:hypothetical protein RIF29_21156 [Crotalaria pallida]|uniref:Uncharacterized protein n=1 Tax=Crotalaria pallida TaxID=3830 RepID=A0AAN9F2A5_CROPI
MSMQSPEKDANPNSSPGSSERVLETPNPSAPNEFEKPFNETIPPENVASAEEEANAVLAAAVRDNKGKEIEIPVSDKEKTPNPEQQNTGNEADDDTNDEEVPYPFLSGASSSSNYALDFSDHLGALFVDDSLKDWPTEGEAQQSTFGLGKENKKQRWLLAFHLRGKLRKRRGKKATRVAQQLKPPKASQCTQIKDLALKVSSSVCTEKPM